MPGEKSQLPNPLQERQSKISQLLVFCIIVMLLIFANCTYNSENDQILMVAIACPTLLILTGIYTLTYRGKAYRTSRILFFILLILSVFSIWAFVYMLALGKAFQH